MSEHPTHTLRHIDNGFDEIKIIRDHNEDHDEIEIRINKDAIGGETKKFQVSRTLGDYLAYTLSHLCDDNDVT